jgi:hypothetical protein
LYKSYTFTLMLHLCTVHLNSTVGLLVIWLCYYLTDTWSMAVVNLSFKHFHILYSLVQQLLDVNRHCSVYHNGVNCKYFPVFNSIRFYNYIVIKGNYKQLTANFGHIIINVWSITNIKLGEDSQGKCLSSRCIWIVFISDHSRRFRLLSVYLSNLR